VPFANPESLCAEIAVNLIINRVYCTNADSDTVTVISGPKIQPRQNGKLDSLFDGALAEVKNLQIQEFR